MKYFEKLSSFCMFLMINWAYREIQGRHETENKLANCAINQKFPSIKTNNYEKYIVYCIRVNFEKCSKKWMMKLN